MIEIPGIQIKGKLGVKDIKLGFERTPEGKRWEGAGTMLIPKAGLRSPGLGEPRTPQRLGEGGLGQGRRAERHDRQRRVPAADWAPVWLRPVRALWRRPRSAGPMIMGHEALSVGGELHLVFGGTDGTS